ncbi:HIT family protein [Desulfatitalea alkaliphila]|uniref:HIT family protein n=1 Tax=Desulfatitalea alkaliphila TaxID=2929485 RepID=A0AA41R776_9BACT|nr:HIT family protein [Desulfatitalea alkaliphila]MCJ8502762.1 HIT family protein [Desulfatitalea alkaliphila]
MTDCIFCRIVAGEVPVAKVYEDDQTLAFMDLGQVNPGHVIVAVKPHVADIYGLSDALAAAAFQTAAKVARAAKQTFHPDGMTLLQANEPAGLQTVFHFHLHVLPRHVDDGVALTWPAKHPPREELERLAGLLREGVQALPAL